MAFFSGISLPTQLTLSYGVGRAAGAVLEPQLQGLVNSSWELITNEGVFVPPDPIFLAQGVAQGQIDATTATLWASYRGLGSAQFQALVDIANVGPGSAYAFELWRRGVIGEAGFRRAVRRLGWEQEWIDDAVQIKNVLLSPAELAVMIQRTVVPNPGILPNQPSTAGSNVPPMPEVNIDPIAEAAGAGVTEERLAALARIIGLPASPDLAARMHFRKIITEGAFNQAILEGNTRGEWAPFLLDGFREILTANQYVEGHLRGWTDQQAMYDGTAKHGMSQGDTDLLFKVSGRPVSIHEITTGEARGGTYPSTYADVPEPYRKSIQESNIRPEWASIHYANRYTYPSPFVLRSLAEAGDLGDAAAVEKILLEIGWKPSLAAHVSKRWQPTGAASDPHVVKAQNQLWTTTHRSYVAEEITDPTATAAIEAAGVTAQSAPAVLALWAHERSLVRKQLSPTQIRKALNLGVVNPATGVAWSIADAHAALLARGYDAADATVFLQE